MEEMTRAILAWHEITARDLPWRGERDPYRVYVSEIMLQQTRTATVRRYWGPFLAAFPDPAALARAHSVSVADWAPMVMVSVTGGTVST